MNRMCRMYVCDTCKFAQYHPMSYCPKCPGKLHRRDVSHPFGYFKSHEEQRDHLTTQGIDYIGEYPKVPEDEQRRIKAARWQLRLNDARQQLEVEQKNGDEKEINRQKHRIEFWEQEIRSLGVEPK